MVTRTTMSPPLTRVPVADAVLLPTPIKSTWILDGAPVARTGSVGRSSDGLTWTDVWDCTAGSFEWHYGFDETVHIVEGGAVVVDAEGIEWQLRPGDVVTFRKGTMARWRVPEYVRKVAFCRRDVPRWMVVWVRGRRVVAREAGRVVRRLRGATTASAPLIVLCVELIG